MKDTYSARLLSGVNQKKMHGSLGSSGAADSRLSDNQRFMRSLSTVIVVLAIICSRPLFTSYYATWLLPWTVLDYCPCSPPGYERIFLPLIGRWAQVISARYVPEKTGAYEIPSF